MISHALRIVANELEQHLTGLGASPGQVELANVGEVGSTGGPKRGTILLSVVNVTPERTLRNVSGNVRDDSTLRVSHQNPPVFLNLTVLVTATQTDYGDALLALSRAIAFFQYRDVFTPETVAPASLTSGAPINPADRLAEFKLIFSLASPSIEEVNHLWGTLGAKQFPFALYSVRMLEMRFAAASGESGLVTEVISTFVGR
jgi:hypothetical protein